MAVSAPQATAPKVTDQVAVSKPSPSAKVAEVVKTPPVEAPAAIWQDNPNHCTDAQYIAVDAPFNCIDKPIQNTAPTLTAAAPAVLSGCGENMYSQFIYAHESGCNLSSVNSLGCRGIGQACPGSKLPCGADYACQNDWFTNYANSAYGGWANAYAFWLGHNWW